MAAGRRLSVVTVAELTLRRIGTPAMSEVAGPATVKSETARLSGAAPETEVVSLLASDANWGRVRSQGSARPNAMSDFDAVVLNVDARPTILGPDTPRLEPTCRRWPRPRPAPTSTGRPACTRF